MIPIPPVCPNTQAACLVGGNSLGEKVTDSSWKPGTVTIKKCTLFSWSAKGEVR